MSERTFGARTSVPPDVYSPERRTALVLTGTGTAGVYHAGVLRALHEAGVKIDVVAGQGIGAVGALLTAIDGAQRLWEPHGFWRSPRVRLMYDWRPALRASAWALFTAVVLVAVPLLLMAAGLVVFPLDFLLQVVGVSAGGGLVATYLGLAQAAVASTALPTWLPRLVLLVLGTAAIIVAVDGWLLGGSRRLRGPFWWRILRSPMSASSAVDHSWTVLWDLLRGAAQLKRPTAADVGRRYTELLSENLGQPGFRELVLIAHDIDTGRDILFALVSESRRRGLIRRATTRDAAERRAEIVDLSGVARDHLTDALAAALAVPLITEPHTISFAAADYWRGEAHRLCDRPSSLARLIEEVAYLDVEQVVLLSAAPESPGPHALRRPRVDGRGRIGEYLQSSEAASVRDVLKNAATRGIRVFVVRPTHNPIGPFDFAGGFDDRSDRTQHLSELMSRGYEDAYHQFIEPVLGASGERVGQKTT